MMLVIKGLLSTVPLRWQCSAAGRLD